MERKIYQLITNAKQKIFVIAMILLTGKVYSQVTYTLNYTGNIQTVTLTAGNWGIECWGANGGSITSAGGGGTGGYSIGQINCATSGSILNIFVGGSGNPANGISPFAGSGGWNGGGGGAAVGRSGAGGGGASDVRLNGISASDRIIVAGGGGGAAYYNSSGPLNTASVAAGGNGGATVAQNGNFIASSGSITVGGGGNGANGATPGSAAVGTASGSICGAGGGASSSGASIGQAGICGGAGGAAGPSAGGSTGSSGGGGGGYSGGAGGVHLSENNSGVAGGGGSGYVGGVTGGFTYSLSQLGYVSNPSTNGHGLVIIRELCSIFMGVVGVNANNAICSPNSVTLTTNAIGNYSWSTGNTTSSVIVVSPTATTVYSVTATSSLNCTASTAFTVNVNAAVPTLTIANTASTSGGICPNATVTLTGGGATTYSWTGGVTNGVPFAPTVSSTYSVTSSNACGTATAAVSISVHPPPTVSGVASQSTICTPSPVSITGVGNAATYSISNNAGNGVNFFPSATANYTVVGTSALGCTNSAVVGVTVVTTPIAPPLASPPLICIGSSATLNSTGAASYTWATPTGVLNTQSIVVNPSSSTIYTLTKSNSNCVNTQTVQLIVNNLPPVSGFAQPTLICASTTASLFGAGALTYTWNGGGSPAFIVTGVSPLVSPSVTTIYTLTASDGTCVNAATIQVATNPKPTINILITPTNNICRGDQVSLTASGAAGYSWTTTGITSNTNAATITEMPTSSIVYVVTGTNNFNCTSTVQQVVVVRPTPTLHIVTTKPLVCSGALSSMTVLSSAGFGVSPCTYTWSANAGAATTSVITVNPFTATSYTSMGLAPNGCTSTVSYPLSVFLPTFAVNSPTASCQGGTIMLNASGANTYTWNGIQPFQSIPVSPAGPTVYIVAATSSSNGVSCVTTKSVQVSIYNNPSVTAVATRTQVCLTESTTIAGGGASTYSLNTGGTGPLIGVYPAGNATTYTLTGKDQNGCIGTTTIQIETLTCVGIAEQGLASRLGLSLYPNPNNGSFCVLAMSDVNVRLENELGQLITLYELNAENQHKVSVNGLSAGVYFVTLTKDGEQSTQKVIVSK